MALVPEIYYRPSSWRLLDDARAALELTSRAGMRNVILSNHAPELPELVDALGLAGLVEATLTSSTLGLEKPNPEIFRTALRLTSAAPDSWMIGDNPIADVMGALAVGMRAILVHSPMGDTCRRTVLDAATEVTET